MSFWGKVWKGFKSALGISDKPTTAQPTPELPTELPPEPHDTFRTVFRGSDVDSRWRNVEDNLRTAADNAGESISEYQIDRSRDLWEIWGNPGRFSNEERRNAFDDYLAIWEDTLIYEDTLAEQWAEWRRERYGTAS